MGFNEPFKNSIGGKISRLVALSVLSAMILLAVFLGFIQIKESVNQKRAALQSTAFIYASALADDIDQKNRLGAQQVLRSIARVPQILYAAALDTDGASIASMGNITFLASDQVDEHASLLQMLTKGNLPIAVDIVRGGENVGKLVLLGDITDIRSQLLWTTLTTFVAAIFASALAFPISAPLRIRIITPIVTLTNAMQTMRQTRAFSKTTVIEAEGETRVLVDTFNSMIGDIHHRDAALQKLAYFDPLTGLPNRVNFQRLLEEHLAEKASIAAVFLLDIDNFHAINDAMGHSIGDALLMDVAARLNTELPENGLIARLGGDEFAVFAPGLATVPEAQLALAKLISSLYAPIQILGHEIHVAMSSGVVLVPEHAANATEVQRHLDLALYDAKKSGVGRTCFFRKELVDSLNEEAALVKGLRTALANDHITAFFQPIVNLKSGRVEGFESLARWIDPEKGHISPGKFIPIAEKSGLISTLGKHILRISCEHAKRWHAAGRDNWHVSVNVSAAQILQSGFIDQVRKILHETQLPPHLLCLELTESLFVGKSMVIVQKMLQEFRELGIKTSLDDFGTGYSSLSYLEHLPFDKLKIDRAFVKDARQGSKNTELLKGIIGLAHGLGMTVVAEGAETSAELSVLQYYGADAVQGYIFAKPMPFDTATINADLIDQKAMMQGNRITG
ncbi:MAG: EAL domain-containing protein [Alphaproteobacteria bacterium]|nr:EAL domain-containing protein [Alphaproteobacteria bacterium]